MKSEDRAFGTETPEKGPANRLNKGDCPCPPVCYIPAHFTTNKGAAMAHESDFQPGSMDISAHKKTYQGFLTGSKWTFLFVLGIMVFLAIFRTH